VAQRVIRKLVERGHNNQTIGAAVGYHHSTVADWRNGVRAPSAAQLERAAMTCTAVVPTAAARQAYPRASHLPKLASRPSADPRGLQLSRWLGQTREHRSGLSRRFVSASRPAKREFELGVGRLVAISLIFKGNSSGYRMGAVNSHGERRSSERDFEPAARDQGAQPSAKNGRIPRLFRADQQTERLSASTMLAEGEELSSNLLCRIFNDLRTTQISVDVAWRIIDGARDLEVETSVLILHKLDMAPPKGLRVDLVSTSKPNRRGTGRRRREQARRK
jgi:hypothetical protein